MDETDARIIAGLKAGDEDAFLELSRGVERPLRGLVRRFVSETAVDDVMQQTWMRALESLDQFQGRARLSTWVMQIGLNLARNIVRRERREVQLPEDVEPDHDCFTAEGNWVAPPPAWPSTLQDPEQLTANRALLQHLESELRKLPDTWRSAVVLCDVEGLAPRDAAAVLEIEDGNLRVLLHRGRARLRQSIEALLEAKV